MVAALLALAMIAGSPASPSPAPASPAPASPAPPSPAPASAVEGIWHNPKDSVAVKTGACGDKLCGWVVRANDEAQADARDGGTPKLIGTALLREYRPSGRDTWSGQIFVPDMGRTFGSTLKLVDTNTITVKGCLIGGFFCKTQTWHRG